MLKQYSLQPYTHQHKLNVQGFALEHAVTSGLSGIHTHRVHLEKPELFSVTSCDPAEECSGVCIAHVQRRKHGHVKVHTTVSSSHHVSVTHIFVVTLISPSRYFLLLLRLLSHLSRDVWRVHSCFSVRHFYLYSTEYAACLQSVARRKRAHFYCPSFDHRKHNCYRHRIYFP